MFKKKRIFTQLIACAVIFNIFLSGIIYAEVNDSQDNTITQLKQEIEEQKEELERIQNLKGKVESDSEDLKNRMLALRDDELNEKAKLKEIEAQLEQVEETLEEKLQAYEEAKKEYIKKQELYNQRLVNMFYVRKKSVIELLLESDGIGGFFKSLKLIGIMAQSDKEMLEGIKISRDVAKEQERVARQAVNEYDAFYEKKKQEINAISQNIEGANTQISALDDELKDLHLSEERAQAGLIEQQKAYNAYMQKQKNYDVQFAGGNGVWPLPSSTEISSQYGYRGGGFDSASGGIHTGVDFAGQNIAGQAVLAAWDGVVVHVEYPAPGQIYFPQAANIIIIKHSDTVSTQYWHLKDIHVQEGQSVAAGEAIGSCGSTGNSTGPHLHFELIIKGSPNVRETVDPMPYLSGAESFD